MEFGVNQRDRKGDINYKVFQIILVKLAKLCVKKNKKKNGDFTFSI